MLFVNSYDFSVFEQFNILNNLDNEYPVLTHTSSNTIFLELNLDFLDLMKDRKVINAFFKKYADGSVYHCSREGGAGDGDNVRHRERERCPAANHHWLVSGVAA